MGEMEATEDVGHHPWSSGTVSVAGGNEANPQAEVREWGEN